jgi:hypothetical protein
VIGPSRLFQHPRPPPVRHVVRSAALPALLCGIASAAAATEAWVRSKDVTDVGI